MATLKQITPFVMVRDLERALTFYEGILGYQCTFKMDGIYAFIRRDSAPIRLLVAGDGFDLTNPLTQQSIYIDVDDVDALYAELKPKLDTLEKGRVRAPFNQDYNQREFHVNDEDVTQIFFGMPTS